MSQLPTTQDLIELLIDLAPNEAKQVGIDRCTNTNAPVKRGGRKYNARGGALIGDPKVRNFIILAKKFLCKRNKSNKIEPIVDRIQVRQRVNTSSNSISKNMQRLPDDLVIAEILGKSQELRDACVRDLKPSPLINQINKILPENIVSEKCPWLIGICLEGYKVFKVLDVLIKNRWTRIGVIINWRSKFYNFSYNSQWGIIHGAFGGKTPKFLDLCDFYLHIYNRRKAGNEPEYLANPLFQDDFWMQKGGPISVTISLRGNNNIFKQLLYKKLQRVAQETITKYLTEMDIPKVMSFLSKPIQSNTRLVTIARLNALNAKNKRREENASRQQSEANAEMQQPLRERFNNVGANMMTYMHFEQLRGALQGRDNGTGLSSKMLTALVSLIGQKRDYDYRNEPPQETPQETRQNVSNLVDNVISWLNNDETRNNVDAFLRQVQAQMHQDMRIDYDENIIYIVDDQGERIENTQELQISQHLQIPVHEESEEDDEWINPDQPPPVNLHQQMMINQLLQANLQGIQ